MGELLLGQSVGQRHVFYCLAADHVLTAAGKDFDRRPEVGDLDFDRVVVVDIPGDPQVVAGAEAVFAFLLDRAGEPAVMEKDLCRRCRAGVRNGRRIRAERFVDRRHLAHVVVPETGVVLRGIEQPFTLCDQLGTSVRFPEHLEGRLALELSHQMYGRRKSEISGAFGRCGSGLQCLLHGNDPRRVCALVKARKLPDTEVACDVLCLSGGLVDDRELEVRPLLLVDLVGGIPVFCLCHDHVPGNTECLGGRLCYVYILRVFRAHLRFLPF